MPGIGEKITVTCACGATLSAPLSAVGKTAPCPKCKATLTVPRPDEADFGVVPEQYDYSMGKGIRYACIAGLIAAAISTGLAVAVENEIGIAAVGIGFACGLAMLAGTKRRAPEVGIITAGITAAAILLSKVAIFAVLVSGHAGRQADRAAHDGPAPEERVQTMLAEEILTEHQDDEDFSVDDANEAAKQRAAAMTPGQRETYIKTRQAALVKGAGQGSTPVAGILAFLLMFHMWDIILFAGAMAAAYFVSTYNDT